MIKLFGQIKSVTKLTGTIFNSASAASFKLQAKTVSPSPETQVVTPDSGYFGLYRVNVEGVQGQEKTVTPSEAGLVVTPDYGYSGLEKVTVEAAVLQEKTVIPTEEAQEITPGSGYYGIKKVDVKAAPLQEKEVTVTTEEQTVTPDDGYYGLGTVIIPAFGFKDIQTVTIDQTEESKATVTATQVDGSQIVVTLNLDADKLPESITLGDETFTVDIGEDARSWLTGLMIGIADDPEVLTGGES